jgi:colicin import membrane protein
MTHRSMLRATALLAMTMLLTACASTEPAAPDVPPPASTSTEQAQARLTAVAAERAAAEARYAAREAVCYDKFFVNRCLDEAREQQRVALIEQRAIEIEAARYLRQAKVDERDRAMAVAEAAYQEEEAQMAANPPAVKTPESTALPPVRTLPAESRAARTKRLQENAARAQNAQANAAANAAATAARRAESVERQKQVARRVAEREAKAAKRAADAAAKKAAAQPAASN